jgi:hypothetical protein
MSASVIYADQSKDLSAALALITTLRTERDVLKDELNQYELRLAAELEVRLPSFDQLFAKFYFIS